MEYSFSAELARQLDEEDILADFRDRFFIPEVNRREAIYFCGNSLGLQPKSTSAYLEAEMKVWREKAVDGHFRDADDNWYNYHKSMKGPMSKLVGAREAEVVPMNNLTTNLHLMLVTFYRPTAGRYKIICEAGAFPSDQYVIESQVKWHGFDPEEAVIEVGPRDGEFTLHDEDILEVIRKHGDSTALILFGGLQYYTGQLFDMQAITKAGHEAGTMVGFDLAHAVGNVPLQLHDWDVDFAVWCTYKYLNSGPGSMAGAFINESFAERPDLPRLAGWWGYDEKQRFKMEKGFIPSYGADGWRLANMNILSAAAVRASLQIFNEASMERLREKSVRLTGFMEFILEEIRKEHPIFRIITPADPEKRGCQLSLYFEKSAKAMFDSITENSVIADYRNPNVIRLAPVPLYNTFMDVFTLGVIIKNTVAQLENKA
ncbi:kynureninase [Roseivirga sp. BDSF3-8]|uniref:kynureninase n=1 Tax=Roseivirga sp. BDSF3-8 TaxID=3241598 RepID=UPI003531F794